MLTSSFTNREVTDRIRTTYGNMHDKRITMAQPPARHNNAEPAGGIFFDLCYQLSGSRRFL